MKPSSLSPSRINGIVAAIVAVLFVGILVLRMPFGITETAYAQQHDVVPMSLELKDGTVEVELWRDVAPKHVERIVTLAKDGFYDGIVFHRVIDGFMAQTGDPTGTGAGGSDLPDLAAEFTAEPFVRGTLGMARSQNPDSANSQFFITFGDAAFLNNNYTVFGRVTAGMEYVDMIKKGNEAQNGLVTDPDKILTFKVSE